MLIKTTELKKAISTVMPGIEAGKVTIEGADLAIFLGGKMMSYNGKVAVSVAMDIGADFGIKAKDLFSLVAKLKDETVELEPDVAANKLKVKSGKLRAHLVMQDITVVSKLLSKLRFGEEKALPSNFIEAAKTVAISDNKTTLKGFAVGKIGGNTMLISTDKVRISAYKLASEMQQLLVDDDLVSGAISYGKPNTYSVVGPWFHLGYENGMHFSMLRNDDTAFPFAPMGSALTRFQQGNPIAKFSFPAGLAEVAERVTTMGDTDANNRLQCELDISAEKLTVIARKNTGEAEEEISWEKPVEIEGSVRASIPVKTLLALAGKATECKVVDIGNSKKALVIQNDSYTMVASCSK